MDRTIKNIKRFKRIFMKLSTRHACMYQHWRGPFDGSAEKLRARDVHMFGPLDIPFEPNGLIIICEALKDLTASNIVSTKKGQAGFKPNIHEISLWNNRHATELRAPKFNLFEMRNFNKLFHVFIAIWPPHKRGRKNSCAGRNIFCWMFAFPFQQWWIGADPLRNFNILILPLRCFLFTPRVFLTTKCLFSGL